MFVFSVDVSFASLCVESECMLSCLCLLSVSVGVCVDRMRVVRVYVFTMYIDCVVCVECICIYVCCLFVCPLCECLCILSVSVFI